MGRTGAGAPGARAGLPGTPGRRGDGRGRAARPGSSEVPRKALPGGARPAGIRPATVPSPQLLSPLLLPLRRSPSLSVASPRLLARRYRRTGARRCIRRGRAVEAPPTAACERPCPPARLAEAPCAPRPTTRGGDQAHVHHVSCSFQRGQILTSVPRVEARFGLAPWAPVAPTFTQRCASACSLPPSSQACCRLPFPP